LDLLESGQLERFDQDEIEGEVTYFPDKRELDLFPVVDLVVQREPLLTDRECLIPGMCSKLLIQFLRKLGVD
jgi:hypothetical protein